MTQTFKIALCVPSYKGMVAVDHATSVQKLLMSSPRNVEWVQVSSVGCGVLPRARNSQAANALALDCTHVLFVDDDIGFEAKDVFRMIARDVGVIGAVCQRRNARWNDLPALAVTPKDMRVYPKLGVAVPIEPRLPMALTLIKTDVFRKVLAQGLAETYINPSATDAAQPFVANFFGYELVPTPDWSYENAIAERLGLPGRTDDGEDHYFCRRAARAGYDIFIDLEAELRHYEGMVRHDYSLKKHFAEHPEELIPHVDADLIEAPETQRVIGVVLPTRGRPERARRAIASLVEKATHPERIKLFLGVDEDDAASVEAFPMAIIRPREKTVAQMIDRLSFEAETQSDIVMRMDDDLVMTTQGWDVIADASIGEWGIYHPDDSKQTGKGFCSLAAMSTKQAAWLRERQGFVHAPWFPFWFTDTWLDEIGDMSGLKTELPIAVEPPEGKGATHGLREIGFWARFFHRNRVKRKAVARELIEAAYDDGEEKDARLARLDDLELLCQRKTEHLLSPEFISRWETRGEAFDDIANARYAEAKREAELAA